MGNTEVSWYTEARPNTFPEYPDHAWYGILVINEKIVVVFWGDFAVEVRDKARNYMKAHYDETAAT